MEDLSDPPHERDINPPPAITSESNLSEAATPTPTVDYQSIATLLDNLRSPSIHRRLCSVAPSSLRSIAVGLGPRRTRNELIPFLETLTDDEDQVLRALASGVAGLVGCADGEEEDEDGDDMTDDARTATTISRASSLLLPLKTLLKSEEKTVRLTSVNSIKRILLTSNSAYDHSQTAAHVASLEADGENDKKDNKNNAIQFDPKMPPSADCTASVLNLLRSLAGGEWFTSRVSACNLFSTILPLTASAPDGAADNNVNDELLKLFSKLAKDETPMVRREAAVTYGEVSKSALSVLNFDEVLGFDNDGEIFTGVVPDVLLPILLNLANDDQDSVRLTTSTNCVSLISALLSSRSRGAISQGGVSEMSDENKSDMSLCSKFITSTIIPLLVSSCEDRSWRVRWTIASNFGDVVDSLKLIGMSENMNSDDMLGESLLGAFVGLLGDNESEVRTASVTFLPQVYGASGGAEKAKKEEEEAGETGEVDVEGGGEPTDSTQVESTNPLIQLLPALAQDPSPHVRSSLSSIICPLTILHPPNLSIKTILPTLLSLLRDVDADVRLNLIGGLGGLNSVVGVTLLSSSLLPAVVQLAEDSKWRVRLAIIQELPRLARELGEDFFQEKFCRLCLSWLGDSVSSIRLAAAQNLTHLSNLFGSKWMVENVLPTITELVNHTSYSRRLTALVCCENLCTGGGLGVDVVGGEMLPVVLGMGRDKVPNIRFNVAKSLAKIVLREGGVGGEDIHTIEELLKGMRDDSDRDVRFHASESLGKMGELGSCLQ